MWRCVSILLAVAFLGVGASGQEGSPASEAASETKQMQVPTGIRGVWKVTELASRAAGAGWEVRATPDRAESPEMVVTDVMQLPDAWVVHYQFRAFVESATSAIV